MSAAIIFLLLALLMLTGMPVSISLGLTVLTFLFAFLITRARQSMTTLDSLQRMMEAFLQFGLAHPAAATALECNFPLIEISLSKAAFSSAPAKP